MKNVLITALILLSHSQLCSAQENSVSARVADVRDQHQYGVYLGFGTPYPSLMGLNVGYNVSDFRVTAGFAELETTTSLSFDSTTGWTQEKMKATTYDVGTEYYFKRGQSWRPLVGVHVGYVDISGRGSLSINGFGEDTLHAYANVGLDYMSQGGYQFAIGYNQGFLQNGNGSIYVNTGRFF